MHFCGIALAEGGSTCCRRGILPVTACEALLLPWLHSLMLWYYGLLILRVAGHGGLLSALIFEYDGNRMFPLILRIRACM